MNCSHISLHLLLWFVQFTKWFFCEVSETFWICQPMFMKLKGSVGSTTKMLWDCRRYSFVILQMGALDDLVFLT